MLCDLGNPMPKGTLVTVKTNNGGKITAPLAMAYRPSYRAVIDVNGDDVVIPATRITSIQKELPHPCKRCGMIVPDARGIVHCWHRECPE